MPLFCDIVIDILQFLRTLKKRKENVPRLLGAFLRTNICLFYLSLFFMKSDCLLHKEISGDVRPGF